MPGGYRSCTCGLGSRRHDDRLRAKAQTGEKIEPEVAKKLIDAAHRIAAVIGCT